MQENNPSFWPRAYAPVPKPRAAAQLPLTMRAPPSAPAARPPSSWVGRWEGLITGILINEQTASAGLKKPFFNNFFLIRIPSGYLTHLLLNRDSSGLPNSPFKLAYVYIQIDPISPLDMVWSASSYGYYQLNYRSPTLLGPLL